MPLEVDAENASNAYLLPGSSVGVALTKGWSPEAPEVSDLGIEAGDASNAYLLPGNSVGIMMTEDSSPESPEVSDLEVDTGNALNAYLLPGYSVGVVMTDGWSPRQRTLPTHAGEPAASSNVAGPSIEEVPASGRPMAVGEAEEALAQAATEASTGDAEPEAGASVAGLTPHIRRAFWRDGSALLQELREKLRVSWMSPATAPADKDAENKQAHPTDGADNDDTNTEHEQRRPNNATGHDVFDADDFLRMVHRLQTMRPEYKHDAEALAKEIVDDDKSTVVNVVRVAAADLRSNLELWLMPENLSLKRGIQTQIKNYVCFLRANALRRLGSRARGWVSVDDAEAARNAEPLLSWQGQRMLLDKALSAFSSPASSSRRSDRGSWTEDSALDYRQILTETKTQVARMQTQAGYNQLVSKKRKRSCNYDKEQSCEDHGQAADPDTLHAASIGRMAGLSSLEQVHWLPNAGNPKLDDRTRPSRGPPA